VRILQQRQQLFEPLGRLIIGVLLLQDLLVILLIPVLSRLPEGTERVLTGLAGTLGLLLAAGVILRWVGPRLIVRLSLDEENLLLVVLSTLFLFLGAAWFLELPLVTGAFFAGLALSGFPIHLLARGQLNSLGDFFHALFFTALGAFLPVPSGVEVLQSLLLASAVLVLTPPLVAIIAERAGLSARPAVAAGLLLAQTSELSLVVALLGVGAGQLPPGILTVVSLITVLTMTATPFLAQDRVQWALLALHPWRQRSDPIHPPQGHILLLGCGRNGLTLLEMLVISPVPVVVVDDDPALVSHLRDDGIQAFRGDISDLRTLERAGLREARLIISTVRRVQENGPALEMAAGIPMFVRTFNDDEATWVAARGGRPILYSEATAEDFMSWLEAGAIPDVADDDL
jgi:Kef-type K+ transport system membrane component KefB